MNILALGGCGEMGRQAVKALLKYGLFDRIVIGDIDLNSASAFAAQCGSEVSATKIDITDAFHLEQLLAEFDLVMNTTGPYFKYGVQVLESCIKSGCDYVDINDDWEPTLAMLDLHQRAVESGITAVIGIGASPGITNMLAAKVANELDLVTDIITGWDLDSAKPEKFYPNPSTAIVHGMHQLTGTIKSFNDGKYSITSPRQKMQLNYPGFGKHNVWTIGHPEAVTMPYYFNGLRSSNNVMTTSAMNIVGLNVIAWLVDRKLMSLTNAAFIAERIEGTSDSDWKPDEILRKIFQRPGLGLPPLFALVSGIKEGQELSIGAMILSAPRGGMAGITGIPLAIGAFLIAQNKNIQHGVFAPEGIFEPNDFFNEFAGFCHPEKRNIEGLVYITRSNETYNIEKDLLSR